jgi:hypothetical protein
MLKPHDDPDITFFQHDQAANLDFTDHVVSRTTHSLFDCAANVYYQPTV